MRLRYVQPNPPKKHCSSSTSKPPSKSGSGISYCKFTRVLMVGFKAATGTGLSQVGLEVLLLFLLRVHCTCG